MMKIPECKTDAEADAFLEQDLSSLDFSQFTPMLFEIAPKDTMLNLRLPAALPEAVRAKAKQRASLTPAMCGWYLKPICSTHKKTA